MAEIVLGIGTSHSPMLGQTAEQWFDQAQHDVSNTELAFAPSGNVLSFEQALKVADPAIATLVNQDHFNEQHTATQNAIATLKQTMADVNPDVVVVVSDDQDELLFEDNMPTFSVYWGDSIPIYKRRGAPNPNRKQIVSQWAYPDDVEVPTDSAFGRHIIEESIEAGFDVSHFNYMNETYGGKVGHRYPRGDGGPFVVRDTPQRKMGMPHGFVFVVRRLMDNLTTPIVPIFQNTCYPPNQPTPRRCFAFGQHLRHAIESWDADVRVAVVASGGLSHFTVDEETDRMLLSGLERNDAETLQSIPRHRLHSAASEMLNWVTVGGIMSELDLQYEQIDYVPVYRSAAGTGGGWGFVRWTRA
jgi:3-O-methylgallate 3,4-dioxygenase